MAANRRGHPRLERTSEGTFLDATAILKSVNAMAAAVRDSRAATNRVAERLDRYNGAENNHEPRHEMKMAKKVKVDYFKEIGRAMRAQQVPEGQRVEFAAYMLRNDAQYWWQGILQLLGREAIDISWEEFSVEFYKKYFPQCFRTAKELELLQLK
ncbi:uncharacterized protein LOC107611291 [Arachis ipaensis]|uniref:uncharacterized protein LOC107611291 n=1 Tax=Arachis ipaensis TaxID=130454 RepID=UPI0007AFE0A0|nr:uncharacterized protein LOC107611291 [Arachis ipaensis]